MVASMKELELRRHLAVQQAAERLENHSLHVLMDAAQANGAPHPAGRTKGEILGGSRTLTAIQRLLDVGAISANYPEFTPEILEAIDADEKSQNHRFIDRYRATPFGNAILQYVGDRVRLNDAKLADALQKFFSRK